MHYYISAFEFNSSVNNLFVSSLAATSYLQHENHLVTGLTVDTYFGGMSMTVVKPRPNSLCWT